MSVERRRPGWRTGSSYRLDPLTDCPLVAGHDLIANYANDRSDHTPPEMRGRAVRDELAIALNRREGRGAPDHEGDSEAGHVLCSLVPVGKSCRRGTLGDPKPKEDQGRGADIGEVVERVAQQSDRVGEYGQDQFYSSGESKPGGRERKSVSAGRHVPRLALRRIGRTSIPNSDRLGEDLIRRARRPDLRSNERAQSRPRCTYRICTRLVCPDVRGNGNAQFACG
jgi:hypothetical protein